MTLGKGVSIGSPFFFVVRVGIRSLGVVLTMAAIQWVETLPAHSQPVFGNYKYPKDLLKRGEGGEVAFQVGVTEKGRAENCVILASSGHPALDKATCDNIVKQARFKPGTDHDGKPKRATFSSRMRWIPEPAPMPMEGNAYTIPPSRMVTENAP